MNTRIYTHMYLYSCHNYIYLILLPFAVALLDRLHYLSFLTVVVRADLVSSDRHSQHKNNEKHISTATYSYMQFSHLTLRLIENVSDLEVANVLYLQIKVQWLGCLVQFS